MNAPESPLSLLDVRGRQIAIRHRPAAAEGEPTVLFLPGYASDMEGQKAIAIDRHCASRGFGCLRMDYSGTGSSPGDFADGTLDRWLDEVLAAVDCVSRPMVIAGSSMGGWLALHAALRRPERIVGLLGIAAAPDFTDWGHSDDEKKCLRRDGRVERLSPYSPEPMVIYRDFWEAGQRMCLLSSAVPLACPVRLVVGEKDEAVPVAVSLKLLQRLQSGDVHLKIIKNGGHRLSEPHEIDALLAELDGLIDAVT